MTVRADLSPTNYGSSGSRELPGAMVDLHTSRDYCRRLTRAKARNFYYGLRLLPEPRRSAMYALYAYMRFTDDIADADDGRSLAERQADLDAWETRTREQIAAVHGESAAPQAGDGVSNAARGNDPFAAPELWPSFRELVRRFNVPCSVFTDAIEGQRRDLLGARYDTFEELKEYCRLVAGVVGVASIHVWGFTGGAQTEQLAVDRGVAFQLTNILRDLREDAVLGRSYFPTEHLARHELTAESLHQASLVNRSAAASRAAPRNVVALLNQYIELAKHYYAKSADLESRITPECRPTLVAMTSIYRGLLEKVEADPPRVLTERVSLSLWTKLRIGWSAARDG